MLADVKNQLQGVSEVVEDLAKRSANNELKEFYGVGFTHKGEPVIYYSGNWHNIAKAAAFMQADFTKHCLGEV